MARPRKKTLTPFSGMTLDQWQSTEALVAWARQNEMFNHLVAVLQNGLYAIHPSAFEGYRIALSTLLAMRTAKIEPRPMPAPDYSEPLDELRASAEHAED